MIDYALAMSLLNEVARLHNDAFFLPRQLYELKRFA